MKIKYLIKDVKTVLCVGCLVCGLIHGEYDVINASTLSGKNVNLEKKDIDYTIDFGANDNAVQNFYVDGSVLYTSQKYTYADAGYVKISKFNIVNKAPQKCSEMWIKSAGHGQTLEVYKYNNKTYILFALKDYTDNVDKGNDMHWSTQIGRIEYSACPKSNAKDYTKFKRFTNLNYANKEKKGFGTVLRTDAALSSDGQTILIWKKNTGNQSEFTAYNLIKFNNYLDKANNGVSFENIRPSDLGIEFSFNDKSGSIGLPSSIQSLELSNKSNGKYSIYIASGNDGLKKDDNKPVKILRFNSAGEKKSEKNIVYKNVFSSPMEIEGLHIVGDKLEFMLVESEYSNGKKRNNVNKRYQYIVSADKSYWS